MVIIILVGYIHLLVWNFSLSFEVFADGSNSTELAKLLVCSSRNIESQVKDLFKVNEETKISQIMLDALSKKIDELETEIKK